jgi:hypothetical protein
MSLAWYDGENLVNSWFFNERKRDYYLIILSAKINKNILLLL